MPTSEANDTDDNSNNKSSIDRHSSNQDESKSDKNIKSEDKDKTQLSTSSRVASFLNSDAVFSGCSNQTYQPFAPEAGAPGLAQRWPGYRAFLRSFPKEALHKNQAAALIKASCNRAEPE